MIVPVGLATVPWHCVDAMHAHRPGWPIVAVVNVRRLTDRYVHSYAAVRKCWGWPQSQHRRSERCKGESLDHMLNHLPSDVPGNIMPYLLKKKKGSSDYIYKTSTITVEVLLCRPVKFIRTLSRQPVLRVFRRLYPSGPSSARP